MLSASIAGVLAILLLCVDRFLSRRQAASTIAKTDADTDKTEAEAGLALDLRWQRWADNLEKELRELKTRVGELELSLHRAETRADELKIALRRTLRWAILLRDALVATGAESIPTIPAEVESARIFLEVSGEAHDLHI